MSDDADAPQTPDPDEGPQTPDPDAKERPGTTPLGGKRRIRRLRRTKRQSSAQDLPTTSDSRPDSRGSSGGTRTDSRPEGPPTRLDASGAIRRARLESAPAAVESDDPLIGSIVDGKYKVLDAIGSGGMATVYKGWHLMLEKPVAIKFIHPSATRSVRWGERFFREARIATELTHKNIVATREFGETADGQYYILMDFCEGRPLGELVERGGPLSPQEATQIAIQVLDALAEAHRRSIIHRDVKPSNILLEEDGTARLLDFGLAKALDNSTDSDVGTRVGAVLGTPRYMSPEQAEGKSCDHLTDIYSLGVVLYELVCGLLPFEGTSSSDQLRARMVEAPLPPSERVPGLKVPAELEAIIVKALAASPGSRWASADAFKAALEEFQRGEQVDAALPLSAQAFEHRGSLELPGVKRVHAHRVRHRALEREGISWIVEPETFRRDVLAAFASQVELTQRVDHPALAPVLTVGAYEAQRLYAFTAWIDGPTLRERIGAGAVPGADVARILRPLLLAVARAHSFGLTHLAIGSRLITLPEDSPVLHGVGILPAARRVSGEQRDGQREDTRALALLALEMFAGAHLDELGEAMICETGLKQAPPAVARVLEHATSAGYPHAGALLRALELADPRYASGSERVLHRRNLKRLALGTLAAAGLVLAGLGLARFLQPQGDLIVQTDPQAKVELDGIKDVAEVHRELLVGADGFARFSDVPAGDYYVHIAKQGRRTQDAATVKAHTTTSITVYLKPAADVPPEPPPEEPPPEEPPPEEPPPEEPPPETSPLTADQRASFNASVARTRTEAQKLRTDALELLADVTLPEAYAAAQASLEKAERVMATGLESREALLARVLSWEQARGAFTDLLAKAKQADPWKRVPAARAAALGPLVQELASADLTVIDQAWTTRRALRGAEGLAAIDSTVAAYGDLPRLAEGRSHLVDLGTQLADADARARSVWDQALDDLLHVNLPREHAALKTRLEDLRARVRAAPAPRQVDLRSLPGAEDAQRVLLADWAQLQTDLETLAASAKRTNGVLSVIGRLSNTVVRKDFNGILALYDDPQVDHYFWKILLPRISSVRFRVGQPTIEDKTAFAPVAEFSYQDTVLNAPARKQSFVVRLRESSGQWKLVSVRQER